LKYHLLVKTYNFESLILRYLFSVKYQIESYHPKYPVDLTIVDDSSKDDTVFYIKKFLSEFHYLFSEIQLIQNERNIGINETQLITIKEVHSPLFHIMDGDDFYTHNNLFQFIDESINHDYTFSPIYKLILKRNRYLLKLKFLGYIRIMYSSNKLKILKRYNSIPNPGSKISLRAIEHNLKLSDELRFQEDLEHHIDGEIKISGGDYLAWLILFKENLFSFKFTTTPIVIYNYGSGISTNKNHPKYHLAQSYRLKKFYGIELGQLSYTDNKLIYVFLKLIYKTDEMIFLIFKINVLKRLFNEFQNFKKTKIYTTQIIHESENFKRFFKTDLQDL